MTLDCSFRVGGHRRATYTYPETYEHWDQISDTRTRYYDERKVRAVHNANVDHIHLRYD
jgi:hypothetical protein